ncbi:hypothetical protein [Litoribrevibacter albus]|uniref:DUF4145 domain-containing protein n=1 Tax=Litoribrevibacter albus TaxID=1473156 RepID=A0AA37S6J7_9GAMM|nr:hypothetical protein [Litoribrevibacter albus]GLQ29857.1 hypothetical protein GCM10007876_03350 [Litoribrevibacter albus]
MNWMEFIIGLLNALAWPAVLLVVIYTFKQQLLLIAPFTKKLKFKDFEVEFGKDIDQLLEKAQTAFPDLRSDPKTRLIQSARHLPNSCILEAWDQLHLAAQTLTQNHFPEANISDSTPYKDTANFLTEQEVLDQRKSKLFNELRLLRNKIAHAEGYEVGGQEAVQYIELCFRLIRFLEDMNTTLSDSTLSIESRTKTSA